MNILYINHYAGSPKYGMEYRPYYMSREWIKAGNRVRIVASAYSHVRSVQPSINGFENIDGIEYYWVPATRYFENGVQRVLNIFSFVFVFFVRLKSILNDFKPDVVIASSTYPLDIYLSRFIAKKYNAKLIFEVHDLWPLSPIELGGMSEKHPFIRLCQHAENFAYKHSDYVVSMLPLVHEHMRTHGLDLNKLSVIPNGVAVDEWNNHITPLSLPMCEEIKSLKNKGYVIFGYSGSHGVPNALAYLLEAAKKIKDEKIVFILVGDGLEKQNLLRYKKEHSLHNVLFFDPIPKDMIPAFLNAIDIAYIGWLQTDIYRFGIAPNKLMDYMMASKPVLHSVLAGNDPVQEASCGVSVLPENIDAIVHGIKSMSSLSKAELYEMGCRGRQFILDNHSYSVLANKFLEVIE